MNTHDESDFDHLKVRQVTPEALAKADEREREYQAKMDAREAFDAERNARTLALHAALQSQGQGPFEAVLMAAEAYLLFLTGEDPPLRVQ